MVHKGLFLNISAIKKIASKMTSHISIIPRDDLKQALRLRRFFISLAIYTFNLSLSYLAYRAGIMELQTLYGFCILLLVIIIILYIVFRTGLNLRMSDPSLTYIQMCVACLVVGCRFHAGGSLASQAAHG